MADFDWKAVVRTVAPALGTVLGGPLGGLALGEISKALLGKPDGSEEEIAAAVQALPPDQYVKLKDAERQYQLRMRELDLEETKVDAGDRADARTLQKSVGGWERFGTFLLAYIIVFIFGYGMYWVLTGDATPISNERMMLVGAVIGYASAKCDQVVSFFFGSSVGSRQHGERLASALDTLAKK